MNTFDAQGIAAGIGASVSVLLALRIYIRYERVFIADAQSEIGRLRKEVATLRIEVTDARDATEKCLKEHALARRHIDELVHEVRVLHARLEQK